MVVLALIVVALRGSGANYWITPAELKTQTQGGAGAPVRVAGRIVNNSLNWDAANSRLVFKIRAPGEKAVLPVAYQGYAPESIVNDSRVIAEGSMEGGTLNAQTVLIRCPENYLPEKAVGEVFRVLKIEGTLYR